MSKFVIWNEERGGYWQYGAVYGALAKATRFAQVHLADEVREAGDEVRSEDEREMAVGTRRRRVI